MADEDEQMYGRKGPRLVHPPPGPLLLRPAHMPEPSTIAPRPWLYGTQLLRGFVSVLVSPGGLGKSSYAMAMALCLATGRPLLGDYVYEQVNVAVLNLEDPMDELNRRLAALMMRHGIKRDELLGRYFLLSGDERGVTTAALEADGFEVVHPDEAALIEEIHEHKIGVLVVDPFAESHTLEENSNPQMILAARSWRRIARATNCAIFLVHHVRKGVITGIDSARGAKALTDSARIGLVLQPMTDEEGERFGVPEDQRSAHVRLDSAKSNMSRPGRANWFRLDSVSLGNGRGLHPRGDSVQCIEAWKPPSVWESASPADLNVALDAISRGPADGVFYTATARGGSKHVASTVLCDLLDLTDAQAKEIIATWLKTGLLVEFTYQRPRYPRESVGVRVDDTKRPTI